MLDDMQTITSVDKSGMLDIVDKIPQQIKETVTLLESHRLPSLFKVDHIVFSGMGSSAISGDIMERLLRDKLDIPVFVNRESDLPKWANKNTLLFSQSYSGNTMETLKTFKHGCQKHCNIIGITSGGKLAEYCEKRNLPHINIPPNLPPRSATMYTLFSSLLALQQVGLLHSDLDLDIQEAIQDVDHLCVSLKKTVPTKDNLAKQIALKLQSTIPHVYGWGSYGPIARRWSSQFNENSKVIAQSDEVPECTHNAIEGWAHHEDMAKLCSHLIIRDEKEESIYMAKRLDYLKDLFNAVSPVVIEIPLRGKRRLAKMVQAMTLGDYISCYLAILKGVDPTPLRAIEELKENLAKL
jgi:glucose/mannose-6-phosphate isomerase